MLILSSCFLSTCPRQLLLFSHFLLSSSLVLCVLQIAWCDNLQEKQADSGINQLFPNLLFCPWRVEFGKITKDIWEAPYLCLQCAVLCVCAMIRLVKACRTSCSSSIHCIACAIGGYKVPHINKVPKVLPLLHTRWLAPWLSQWEKLVSMFFMVSEWAQNWGELMELDEKCKNYAGHQAPFSQMMQ